MISDVNDEEILYYTAKMNDYCASPQFDIVIDGDLDIFNYHFQETHFPDWEESPSRRSNVASPSKGSKKVRTRSEELSPTEIFEDWGDEIFDKYN